MTKYNKTCSFIGHSQIEITNNLRNRLKRHIIDFIENKGVSVFYFGGFGEFDELCHTVVTELRNTYPFIKRIYCLEDERYIRETKRPKYLTYSDYEEFIYLPLSFNYWYTRIYYRNCAMIDQSDYIIFYITHTENSGAYKAHSYAKRKRKNIINLTSVINYRN